MVFDDIASPKRVDFLNEEESGSSNNSNSDCDSVASAESDVSRCDYILLLRERHGRPCSRPSSTDPEVIANDLRWRKSVLLSFELFREKLAHLGSYKLSLSGEVGDVFCAQRFWTQNKWIAHIKGQSVTTDILGTCDSVRACSVLEASIPILTQLKEWLIAKAPTTEKSPTPYVFEWVFAALASLDTLQALVADTAYVLQQIRRLSSSIYELADSPLGKDSLKTQAYLVEVLIEDFFKQI